MSDVEDIDCTTTAGDDGVSHVRKAHIVPVALTLHEVWCGSSHRVKVDDMGMHISRIIRTPAGVPDGHEVWVDGTVLVLRYKRNDRLQRRDAAMRYTVRVDGDDVLFDVDVDAGELRDGFTRDLSVEEEDLRPARAHLRIKCPPGRAGSDRPMRFDRKGVAGRGAAIVRFRLSSL